jgi:DNA-binding LacI/PurR family transcriptional regulator
MADTVRLQDVADLAGVSMGTASQALNNRPTVAAETRARVLDAAHTLGYPVRSSSEIVESQLEVIGVLAKHDFGVGQEVNPFYSHVHVGIENECRAQKLALMVANVEVDASNRPLLWPPMLNEDLIQGLLLVGTFIEDTVGLLRRRLDLPIVLIDGYAPTMPFDSIVIDNAGGTRSALEHLVDHGHRAVGLIGTNPQSPPSVLERRQSYVQFMRDHALPESYIEDSKMRYESGYAACLSLLRRAPEVTAIFAASDLVAIGVLNGARDLGIQVPDQLSVAGFDNIDMASVVTPALTTVHVHKTWLGALGVRQLVQRAKEPRHPKVTIAVTTRLVQRDSVGPCPVPHAQTSSDALRASFETVKGGV